MIGSYPMHRVRGEAVPPMPTDRSRRLLGPLKEPRQNWTERFSTSASRARMSHAGGPHPCRARCNHWRAILSKALFWSAKKAADEGAGGSEATASRMYCSTASRSSPRSSLHSGPGPGSGPAGCSRCRVAAVILGPRCPPFLGSLVFREPRFNERPNQVSEVSAEVAPQASGQLQGAQVVGALRVGDLGTQTSRSTDGPRARSSTSSPCVAA